MRTSSGSSARPSWRRWAWPRPRPGSPVANEWWRVTNGNEAAGYGWLDSEWGDARITFVVAPGQRGRGVGDFILEHLEDEAAARGLNYIYNVVPETPSRRRVDQELAVDARLPRGIPRPAAPPGGRASARAADLNQI